jgi:hypothetical protein
LALIRRHRHYLSCWLLGKKADGKRRNTRRRQQIRLAIRANKTVRLILSSTL